MIPIADSIKSRRFAIWNLIFVVVTIYVFFFQLTALDPESFIYQYALIPANVDFGNYYSLLPFITSIFLHGGFLHIIANMLFLWVFGDNVEGHLPFLLYPILYIGSGVVGALTQYFFMPDSQIPMLGASGAVAGALGAYFTLFPRHKIKTLVFLPPFVTTIEVSAFFMLGYWFLLQIFSGIVSIPMAGVQTGGVAFFAHIGGFVFGLLFAKLFAHKDNKDITEDLTI